MSGAACESLVYVGACKHGEWRAQKLRIAVCGSCLAPRLLFASDCSLLRCRQPDEYEACDDPNQTSYRGHLRRWKREMKETPPLMANADRFSLPLSSVPHIDEIGRGRTSPCPRLELAAATKDQDGMGDEIWEPASCTMVMPR